MPRVIAAEVVVARAHGQDHAVGADGHAPAGVARGLAVDVVAALNPLLVDGVPREHARVAGRVAVAVVVRRAGGQDGAIEGQRDGAVVSEAVEPGLAGDVRAALHPLVDRPDVHADVSTLGVVVDGPLVVRPTRAILAGRAHRDDQPVAAERHGSYAVHHRHTVDVPTSLLPGSLHPVVDLHLPRVLAARIDAVRGDGDDVAGSAQAHAPAKAIELDLAPEGGSALRPGALGEFEDAAVAAKDVVVLGSDGDDVARGVDRHGGARDVVAGRAVDLAAELLPDAVGESMHAHGPPRSHAIVLVQRRAHGQRVAVGVYGDHGRALVRSFAVDVDAALGPREGMQGRRDADRRDGGRLRRRSRRGRGRRDEAGEGEHADVARVAPGAVVHARADGNDARRGKRDAPAEVILLRRAEDFVADELPRGPVVPHDPHVPRVVAGAVVPAGGDGEQVAVRTQSQRLARVIPVTDAVDVFAALRPPVVDRPLEHPHVPFRRLPSFGRVVGTSARDDVARTAQRDRRPKAIALRFAVQVVASLHPVAVAAHIFVEFVNADVARPVPQIGLLVARIPFVVAEPPSVVPVLRLGPGILRRSDRHDGAVFAQRDGGPRFVLGGLAWNVVAVLFPLA